MNFKRGLKKTLKISGKTLLTLILIFLLAVFITGFSYVYNFEPPKPFSGPDIFNPYKGIDTTAKRQKANFHTHTRVSGPLNECKYTARETSEAYQKLGYDILTFSNHNELTKHPYDSTLQVNVYEHGYNIFKYHKLVFGPEKVFLFDQLIPWFAFQKQFQLDKLAKGSDFIQLNHPFRTNFFTEDQMQKLEGFHIMELDSGVSTENEYWDWSLSAGHYSFGLANDDLHYPDRSDKIGIRANFLSVPSGQYKDLKEGLLSGNYYSMRIPDYGWGDWNTKYERHKNLPAIKNIGVSPDDEVYIRLSAKADSIKFIGENHKTLNLVKNDSIATYKILKNDPYVRISAFFPDGEIIYSNPFARYDASVADSPFREPSHTVNITLTILYNILLFLLCAGDIYLIYLVFKL